MRVAVWGEDWRSSWRLNSHLSAMGANSCIVFGRVRFLYESATTGIVSQCVTFCKRFLTCRTLISSLFAHNLLNQMPLGLINPQLSAFTRLFAKLLKIARLSLKHESAHHIADFSYKGTVRHAIQRIYARSKDHRGIRFHFNTS